MSGEYVLVDGPSREDWAAYCRTAGVPEDSIAELEGIIREYRRMP